MAYVATVVRARLVSMDVSLEEAATDLGSRPWKVLRTITLPIIAPAILAGWLLAFTLSLDDVVITSFTTGPGATTLPILIWSKVKLGVTPDINALATLIVVVVGIGVAIAGVVLHRLEAAPRARHPGRDRRQHPMTIVAETPEDATQLADLKTPLGQPGSGRVRYAAATHFYNRGKLSADALEVYRILALIDAEDPAPLLARNRELARLVAAAENYLATLEHRGKAGGAGGSRPPRSGTAGRRAGSPVVDAHLPAALAAVAAGGQRELAAAIAAAAPSLAWDIYDKYPIEAIGQTFRSGHAYASLVGPDGPFTAGDYDLGLFLIAPGVFYRDHRHAAPELYAPLTGPHGWRFAPGDPLDWLPAHVPVWNEPHRPHATKVGRRPLPLPLRLDARRRRARGHRRGRRLAGKGVRVKAAEVRVRSIRT